MHSLFQRGDSHSRVSRTFDDCILLTESVGDVGFAKEIRSIPHSATVVARRQDLISSNLQDQLLSLIRRQPFARQFDESTDIETIPWLVYFVRTEFSGRIVAEFWCSLDLQTYTKAHAKILFECLYPHRLCCCNSKVI